MSNKYNYTSISNAAHLIKNEIIAAKGAISTASNGLLIKWIFDFFTTKDVKELANDLITRYDRRNNCTVINVIVSPINNPIEGIASANYDFISNFNPDDIKLENEEETKTISVVIPDETIKGEYVAEYLYKLRKKLLRNPVNYLLNLGKMFKRNSIFFPERLLDFEIIAYPENKDDLRKYPGSIKGKENTFFDGRYAIAIFKGSDRNDKKSNFGIMRVAAAPDSFHNKIAFICEDII